MRTFVVYKMSSMLSSVGVDVYVPVIRRAGYSLFRGRAISIDLHQEYKKVVL